MKVPNCWQYCSLDNENQCVKLARTNKVTKGNDKWQQEQETCNLGTNKVIAVSSAQQLDETY